MSRNRRPSASDRGPRVGATTPPQPLRVDAVDALRGLALCLMIGYHFCFDLRHFGWLAADFEHDLFWLGLRALILSTFMALVGVSLVLADRAGQEPAHFRRRLGAVAACAALVSAASYVVFPQSFIYFGVLHCIVVATLHCAAAGPPAVAGTRARRRDGRRRQLRRRTAVRRAGAVVHRPAHGEAADRGLRPAVALGRRHAAGSRSRHPLAHAAQRRRAGPPAARHACSAGWAGTASRSTWRTSRCCWASSGLSTGRSLPDEVEPHRQPVAAPLVVAAATRHLEVPRPPRRPRHPGARPAGRRDGVVHELLARLLRRRAGAGRHPRLDGHLRLRRRRQARRQLHADRGRVGRRHECDGRADPGDGVDGHCRSRRCGS